MEVVVEHTDETAPDILIPQCVHHHLLEDRLSLSPIQRSEPLTSEFQFMQKF
jgi:hypothetical protein